MKIKELYKKCLEEKWTQVEMYLDDPDISTDEALTDIFDLCPFCVDCINNAGKEGKETIPIVTGDNCAKFCRIDKNICGSEGSLMAKLEVETDEYSFEEAEEIAREVIKELKKHAE